MRYLFAILLPPVAVLMCYRPISALLNVLLCVLFWIPGVIHAILLVASFEAKQRTQIMAGAINRQTAVLEAVSTAQAARSAPVIHPVK